MPQMTVAGVRKYTAASHRREIRDSLAVGLYLIIQPKPSGAKSWAMRFRRPDGRPAKLTLGRVDLSQDETADAPQLGGALTLRQARQLANEIDRRRARGQDVIAEHAAAKHSQRQAAQRRGANTFEVAAREFFTDYKVKRWGTQLRGWQKGARLLGLVYPADCDPAEVEPRIIKGSLADTWADRPVAEISDDDVFAAVDSARRSGIPGLGRKGKGASDARGRKLHGQLSVLFRWLVRHRRVKVNPLSVVERPAPPAPRQRVLSEAEIRIFWKACDRIGPPFGPLFQTLLLTGCRLAEAAFMRRAELSEDGSTWTIPSERVKNHRPHLVPLAPLARAAIASAPQVAGEASLVFTLTGRALGGFSRAKANLDAIMLKVARDDDPTASIQPWRLHDLRRTAATHMADIGIAPHVVEAVLNHVSGHKAGVAGVYNQAEYRLEKQAALERWAAHVDGVVTGRPANVVASKSSSTGQFDWR
jgi:integrase